MGYYIKYKIHLKIKKDNFNKAIEIANHLHSDEMLTKYARGSCHPPKEKIRDSFWYSWVENPQKPYTKLIEVFKNWNIAEQNVCVIDNEEFFIYEGDYENKWGQQDFFLEQMSPILEDFKCFVYGEDENVYIWSVKNGVFATYEVPRVSISDSETDSE